MRARRVGVFGKSRALWPPRWPCRRAMPRRDHGAARDHRRPRVPWRAPIAADTASRSWPSTSTTCQSATRKRAATSSLIDSVGAAVVGDAVVVPQQDQLAQPQVSGQRDHFLADAFLQAAVADEGIGVVVDQAVAEAGVQIGLGHRHAERVGDALAERPGRHLDAARRGRTPDGLRSASRARGRCLICVDRDALVARQVQQRVQQHRAVAVGQHDAVAVGPGRIGGIELQVPRVERGRDLGHAERHALMAFAGAHDGVDGEEADRVGELR